MNEPNRRDFIAGAAADIVAAAVPVVPEPVEYIEPELVTGRTLH